jgi:hypothetical protein
MAARPLLDKLMIEAQLVGKHISEFVSLLGFPVVVPDRPPEGDPEFGLDRHVEVPARGFAILVDWNDTANCVQFFSEGGQAGYRPYLGPLPHGLSFASSRAQVRQAMGEPVKANDGGRAVLGLKIRPWDWFASDGRKVHFEYQDGGEAVRMVSVMPLPSES